MTSVTIRTASLYGHPELQDWLVAHVGARCPFGGAALEAGRLTIRLTGEASDLVLQALADERLQTAELLVGDRPGARERWLTQPNGS